MKSRLAQMRSARVRETRMKAVETGKRRGEAARAADSEGGSASGLTRNILAPVAW
jgi:hypothetical protein